MPHNRKKSKYPSRARQALLLGVMVAVGAGFGAGTAGARERHGDHRDFHRHHREFRGYRGWTAGYYAAPPVVYGYPYYEPDYYPGYYYPPPPVVYGPGIGVNLHFNVH